MNETPLTSLISTDVGPCNPGKITIALATERERQIIYQARHNIYAQELAQHPENPRGLLSDPLDAFNVYLTASVRNELVGFISITPPTGTHYSIDKYLRRDQLPFSFDLKLYEVRLLTVRKPHRGRQVAVLLMYAALRWVEAHGGTRIVAIGRRQILDLYLKVGLEPVGVRVQSGAVTYEILQATTSALRQRLNNMAGLIERLESEVDWQLAFAFRKPASCFHGGAFFTAIGDAFESLERSRGIINADVLDAWFPPAPGVIAALEEHLPWLLRTSPPTHCEGLVRTIARVRGVEPDCILPGAGSSDLIFLAFRQWLSRESRVLILDPTYGEYAHVLERVVGCRVDRLVLPGEQDYRLDLDEWAARFADGYDLVVLVNPNSPTGQHVRRESLQGVLAVAPHRTRVWVDETYVEYAGANQSMESFAAQSENVIVCKSMSKVYALSGARAAYLCAAPHQLEELRSVTPPWAVSLPAQIAAVKALEDPEYYAQRYRQTREFRLALSEQLLSLGWKLVPGVANFILGHLPVDGPDAATVTGRCRERGLFLRDASSMGTRLGNRALRIAVKDRETNCRMAEILRKVCDC